MQCREKYRENIYSAINCNFVRLTFESVSETLTYQLSALRNTHSPEKLWSMVRLHSNIDSLNLVNDSSALILLFVTNNNRQRERESQKEVPLIAVRQSSALLRDRRGSGTEMGETREAVRPLDGALQPPVLAQMISHRRVSSKLNNSSVITHSLVSIQI